MTTYFSNRSSWSSNNGHKILAHAAFVILLRFHHSYVAHRRVHSTTFGIAGRHFFCTDRRAQSYAGCQSLWDWLLKCSFRLVSSSLVVVYQILTPVRRALNKCRPEAVLVGSYGSRMERSIHAESPCDDAASGWFLHYVSERRHRCGIIWHQRRSSARLRGHAYTRNVQLRIFFRDVRLFVDRKV